MKSYLFKLLPPRPTFMQDMTETELNLMRAHSAYWHGHLTAGAAVAFGPVADPAGPYGVGILELDDAADPKTLVNQDPAMLANAGFKSEIYVMPRLIARKA